MESVAHKLIKEYLNFGGEGKTFEDFNKLRGRINQYMLVTSLPKELYIKLQYVLGKLEYGLHHALMNDGVIDIEITDTEESIEAYWLKFKKENCKEDEEVGSVKRKPKRKEELGKLVDEGEAPYPDRSDEYWRERVKMAFALEKTRLRRGQKVPASYLYYDMIFLKEYYNLRSIAFGNWVSQQDRWNYIAAMGIGLFDLHHVLSFRESQVSLGGKLSVAFGARGRGAAAAHFENKDFVINITRYSRRDKKKARAKGDKELNYLTASEGMGAFAHEYGHALDYYAGTFIRSAKGGALSEGRSRRVKPNKRLMKEDNAAGYMERLLNKIIWKNEKTHSSYYKRLLDSKEKPYYYRRNELFARSFESYVHYKMQKRKYFNVFLAETKYPSSIYLTPSEIKALEKDFDQLINAIKWKIKTR